jgi:hypothetical protein
MHLAETGEWNFNFDFINPNDDGGGNNGGGNSGGGGRDCFAPSTPVWTPDGMVPISEIKVGDKVFTMDMDTGEVRASEVMETFTAIRSGIVKVETKTNSVVCSNNHRYFTEEGEWRQIHTINGENLKTANGPTKVKVTKVDGEMKVHNFEVRGTKNYFVGSSKLLVHNHKPREWEYP